MKQLLGAACSGAVLSLVLFSAASAGAFDDGRLAYERGDYAAALKIWRPLAESGDGRAEYMLGRAYTLGRGLPQDYAKAAFWYRKAADQGVASARANLGWMYANGQGVPLDYAAAIKLWREADGLDGAGRTAPR